MAGPGGIRKRIGRITGRLRPGRRTASKPASLGVDLNKGVIKPPSVPIGARLNRAKQGIKKNIGRPVDGVRNGQKTLGAPEEEKLREEQGIPPKNPRQNIPGGRAIEPRRKDSQTSYQEEPDEEEGGKEDQLVAQQNRRSTPPPEPPEEDEIEAPPESDDDSEESEQEKNPNIKNSAANRAIDYLRKTAKKWLSKEARSAVIKFIVANWYYIVAALILIIFGFVLFSYLWGSANKKVSDSGQTMTQVYDPARDRPTLQAVLQLSGDKAVQQLASWTFVQKLQKELISMESDAGLAARPDHAEITGKIDSILGDIQTYSVSKDAATGKKIINGIKELWEMFGIIPTLADAGSPLPAGSILSFGKTVHTGTPTSSCNGKCSGHHSTFYQSYRNTCDAVDLQTKNGTPIYAAFAGKVVKFGPDSKGEKNHFIVFIQNDQGYLAVYAHFTQYSGFPLTVGEPVAKGQQIGVVGRGHLHFELAQNGKCVVTTPQDIIDGKTQKKSPEYFLWQRMAKVLNTSV